MQVRLCLSGDGPCRLCFFFFNDTATTEIYTLSLHDALPISMPSASTMTSCGSIVFRGRSYSVMMTRVDGPVGRGSVLSANGKSRLELKLMLARYRARSSVPAPNRRTRSGALPRVCGGNGKLLFA